MVYKRVCRNCPISSCGAKYLVRLANHLADVHQLEHIQRRQYLQERNYNLKLKWSFTKVKRIIPEKITIAIQCRHKKRCRNCQDHGEMKPLLKQKLKEPLQRTRQNERNKESRTLGLEAIGELCRHGRIISYSSKKGGENGIVIVSQKINFHSFSFQIAVYLTLFVIVF